MAGQIAKSAIDYLQRDKRQYLDETPRPVWADGPDGRPTKIDADTRFDQLFAEWQADACEHPETGIIRWVNGGNQACYNWFCRDCGQKLSTNIPHALAEAHGVKSCDLDTLASRERTYLARRQDRLDTFKRQAAERAQPENRGEYDDYLRSPRWLAMRSRIFQRAGHRCEGCLDAPAVHVHHLTYAHRGDEFAFELLALCAACHHRLHDQEAAE